MSRWRDTPDIPQRRALRRTYCLFELLCVVMMCAVLSVGASAFGALTRRGDAPIASAVNRRPCPSLDCRTPATLLAIGDSLTVGYYTTARTDTFPYVLANEERLATPVIVGHGGYTTGDILRIIGQTPITGSYTYEVVELGTNDWLHVGALDTFQRNYQRILNGTAPHRAHLICLGVWMSDGAVDMQGYTAAQFNTVIQGECLAADGMYVPLGPLYDTPTDRCPPGSSGWRGPCDTLPSCAEGLNMTECPFSHPGDAGDRAIAQAIIRDAFTITA